MRFFWNNLNAEQPTDPTLSSSSSTSGSRNSSSSSSSTSSTPRPQPKEKSQPKQASPRPSQRSRSPSAKGSRTSTAAALRDKTNHIQYGIHFMIVRYDKIGGGIQGYHTNCKCNAHEKCTKELSVGVAGDPTTCRRILKSWALLGAGHRDRMSHMKPALKKLLLSAARDGSLLTEPELDLLGGKSPSPVWSRGSETR